MCITLQFYQDVNNFSSIKSLIYVVLEPLLAQSSATLDEDEL